MNFQLLINKKSIVILYYELRYSRLFRLFECKKKSGVVNVTFPFLYPEVA